MRVEVVQGMGGTWPLIQSPPGYDIMTAAPQLPREYHLIITQGRGHNRNLGKSFRLKSLSFLVCKMG